MSSKYVKPFSIEKDAKLYNVIDANRHILACISNKEAAEKIVEKLNSKT